jgi:hypothetical protein
MTNVYENIPFAGDDGDYSILSVLFGAHSIGEGIFSYLTMIDSNKVRVQCRECHQAVKDFPWMDAKSRIQGNVKVWRAAFPYARCVNVSGRADDIVDADFIHIRGDLRTRLHTVNMWGCNAVTDAAFVHLRGIHTLDISWCTQPTITDAAFVHLRGIHTLNIQGCNQSTITQKAVTHLVGIRDLCTRECRRIIRTSAAQLLGVDYESDVFDGGVSASEEEEQDDDEESDDEEVIEWDDSEEEEDEEEILEDEQFSDDQEIE